jgi:hypothetical protein
MTRTGRIMQTNLATALTDRYERDGSRVDLARAVGLFADVISVCAPWGATRRLPCIATVLRTSMSTSQITTSTR